MLMLHYKEVQGVNVSACCHIGHEYCSWCACRHEAVGRRHAATVLGQQFLCIARRLQSYIWYVFPVHPSPEL